MTDGFIEIVSKIDKGTDVVIKIPRK